MILTPFDVKFHNKKNELLPRACRPLKKLKKSNVEKVAPKEVKKNNVDKEGSPPARPSARPPERGVRGGSPLGQGKRGYIKVHRAIWRYMKEGI